MPAAVVDPEITSARLRLLATLLRPLAGRPAPAPSEPTLVEAMLRHGVTLEEELLVDELIADLDQAAG